MNIDWYTLLHIISMISAVAFNIYYGNKLGVSKAKSALSSAFSLALLYMVMLIIPWVESGFTVFGKQNMVKAYAFAPIIFVIVSLVFRIDFRTVSDMHAVWPMLLHGISHFGCILLPEPCCGGFQYCEGTKMHALAQFLTGTDKIPNQIFESCAALIIAAAFFLIARKMKFRPNGKLFYIMIIVYGINRFFWEFFRDNNKIIVFKDKMDSVISGSFGLSDLSFYCIAMITVGISFLVALTIIDKKKAKKNNA